MVTDLVTELGHGMVMNIPTITDMPDSRSNVLYRFIRFNRFEYPSITSDSDISQVRLAQHLCLLRLRINFTCPPKILQPLIMLQFLISFPIKTLPRHRAVPLNVVDQCLERSVVVLWSDIA